MPRDCFSRSVVRSTGGLRGDGGNFVGSTELVNRIVKRLSRPVNSNFTRCEMESLVCGKVLTVGKVPGDVECCDVGLGRF